MNSLAMWSSPFFLIFLSSLLTSLLLFSSNSSVIMTLSVSPLSSSNLSISIIIDWSSLLFIATVTFISASIILFSMSYIPKNELPRFLLILISFVVSMIILISSNNIFFIMLGWDGLGFSSFILVIYYQNFKSSESGILTILSNRVGDIAMILSISILSSSMMWDFFSSNLFPFPVLTLLILAAITKSAQIPFMAWLPAAMAAPTPISALVHSSTLVTAGVFLMIRIMNSPHPTSLSLILLISSLTMFSSGLAANWEHDLKKIIALSTLSQIAFMMFAISSNSPLAAFFHLITHALFKSTLFMAAGAIIHGSSYQDSRSMGLLSTSSPLLSFSFSITSMALMGLPFLSGFFSKDVILENMLSKTSNIILIPLIIMSLGLTASYTLRMISKSSSWINKSCMDCSFSLDSTMALCLIIMTPSSIFLGSSLSWLIISPNTFFISFSMKTMILLMIITGMMIGASLSFKSSSYKSLGPSAISLWASHNLSCLIPMKFMVPSSIVSKLDKTWMEISSAQGLFYLSSMSSKLPSSAMNLRLIPLMILLSTPLLFSLLFFSSLQPSNLLKMKSILTSSSWNNDVNHPLSPNLSRNQAANLLKSRSHQLKSS